MKITNKVLKLMTNSEVSDFIKNSNFFLSEENRKFLSKIEQNENNCFLEKLKIYKLTEFEKVNIINNKPKSLVHLQNLIDEMLERFDENEMNEILKIFL